MLVAGYASGTVASIRVHASGALGSVASVSQHNGTSSCNPNTPAGGRQTSPHPHSIVAGPTRAAGRAADAGGGATGADAGERIPPAPDRQRQYFYAPDLGLDKVFQYALDAATGSLIVVSVLEVAPCSGPRHLTFSPAGTHVYLLHEMVPVFSLHPPPPLQSCFHPSQCVAAPRVLRVCC
jgi:6-phosphogluconolactonase